MTTILDSKKCMLIHNVPYRHMHLNTWFQLVELIGKD